LEIARFLGFAMKIIVVGTHEYFWALRIFTRQFNRYWKFANVVHYGDVECADLPPNFESRRVPCYAEGSWPWDHWYGNGLISILESIPDRTVALFLPDHWINAPVDKLAVRALDGYMLSHPDVVRGNLTAGTCLAGYGETVALRDACRIVQVHPGDPHCGLYGGTVGSPALWNRNALLEVLEPHWGLWDAEKVGTEKMARGWPRWRSVGIEPAPVSRTHGLVHGKPKVASFEGMSREDAEMCAKMLPEGWEWTA